MARVTFYVLEQEAVDDALRFVCRLADQLWQDGRRSVIKVAAEATAERLDTLLWTFRDRSFLAHERSEAADPKNPPPVTVAVSGAPTASGDVLINVDADSPERPDEHERIVELVFGSDAMRERARKRFKAYRDQGLTPDTHHINAAGATTG